MGMPGDLQSEMAAAAQGAVQHAKKYWATELDYSPQSIEDVELILARMHDSIPRGFLGKWLKRRPTDEQMAQVALAYGAYLGEILRREFGGTWSKETAADQPDMLALKFSDQNMIFPTGKVWKRLQNGAQENVNDFYQQIRTRLQKAI